MNGEKHFITKLKLLAHTKFSKGMSLKKVAYFGLFFSFLLLALAIFMNLTTLNHQIETGLQHDSLQKTQLIARVVNTLLLTSDYNEIQKIAQALRQDDQITSIEIRSKFEEVIYKYESPNIDTLKRFYTDVSINNEYDQNKKVGQLSISYSYNHLDKLFRGHFIWIIFEALILFGALMLTMFGIFRAVVTYLNNLLIQLGNLAEGRPSEMKPFNKFEELKRISSFFNTIVAHFQEFRAKEQEQSRLSAIQQIASQVAHDIRSPLSALNMMMGQLDKVPEQQRVLMRSSIQRINDIANELLQKGKQIQAQEKKLNSDDSSKESKAISGSLPLKVELLAPIIDSLVSEKRIQFREKQGVNIEADVNLGYGLFANINSTELKRTISNLLNNAIEAFPEAKGRVVVALRSYSKMACLIVQDNGKGIPEHILAKLGEMGLSHGKEGSQSGSGLGVYHAKKTVESFGGKFDVVSKVDHGTTITMSFPRAQAPSWFVEKLVFKHNSKVISLDDDLSIHQVWKGRFESKNFSSVGIEHMTFTSGNEFKEWLKKKPSDSIKNPSEECLFLMDYELLNQKATGLDIIEELDIGAQAILVSSRYEEDSIRSRCEKLGVKLIPKAMAGFVPIEIEKPKELYHAVLIDDDILPHMTWGMMAEEKNKKFIGFYKPEDFFNKAHEIDFESPIYVDSNLGNNVKGEEVSLKIHEMGFKNIHLCTGYDPSEFPQMHWIKSICPKDPQF